MDSATAVARRVFLKEVLRCQRPASCRLPGWSRRLCRCPDREGQDQVDAVSTAVDTSIARTGQADVAYVPTGQLLTKTTGFMDAYDFTLNPYSGCSFGCTYCYAAFFSRDTAKRDNWGYWVSVKANAIELLKKRRRSLGR